MIKNNFKKIIYFHLILIYVKYHLRRYIDFQNKTAKCCKSLPEGRASPPPRTVQTWPSIQTLTVCTATTLQVVVQTVTVLQRYWQRCTSAAMSSTGPVQLCCTLRAKYCTLQSDTVTTTVHCRPYHCTTLQIWGESQCKYFCKAVARNMLYRPDCANSRQGRKLSEWTRIEFQC